MYQTLASESAAPPVAATASDDALYRKVSRRLIPFLFISYVISFLDRINVGFAQLQLKQDLGFSDAMYGLGAAVFYIGYVLFEVPSNLLLAKYGARKTFVRIMLLWGAASVGMMFISTPTHFYALRFALGVFEAGFFPGIVLYLTYWYPPLRRASVLSYFFAGVAVAGILGGLVSGWIIRDMNGVLGMKGWQWMFVLEGAPALVLAVIAYFYLQDTPLQAHWLTQAEKVRLVGDVEQGRQGRVSGGSSLSACLRDPRVYLFSVPYFALTAGALTLSFWMPLMIRDFGVKDVLHVSLYSVIPYTVGAVGVLLLARAADRYRSHAVYLMSCMVVAALALAALTTHPASLGAALALLAIAAVALYSGLPIFWAIPTAYLSPEKRAGGIGIISSLGTSAGIAAPWAIGQVKAATGNMDAALLGLGALLIVSALVLAMAQRGSVAASRSELQTR